MINHFVQSIGGIGNFGMISISLFFIVFTGAHICAFLLNKAFVQRMESLPLEDGEIRPATQEDGHE